MRLDDFSFDLPPAQIAQYPLDRRDASRMLILDRKTQSWEDSSFSIFPDQLLGDELIVVNNARVIPARLFGRRLGVRAEKPGHNRRTLREFLSSEIEVLLTRRVDAVSSPVPESGQSADRESDLEFTQEWEALVRPGRKMRVGEHVEFGAGELSAEVIGRGEYGLRRIRLTARGDVNQDRPGAVAAPTAGLHFSPAILEKLRKRNIDIAAITLDVGLGTFQPIHEEEIEQHKIHSERYEISETSATAICQARREGRPILAIGTTVVRALEEAAARASLKNYRETDGGKLVEPGAAEAEIFIKPGHDFRAADQLLTNFHLPQSTLLLLVSAFAGREWILSAYRHAVQAGYRFYSYGDCMWIR